MPDTIRTDELPPALPPTRTADQDLELWKHHASFGGEDKNRMVTIASWLLGLSAAMLAYAVTSVIAPSTPDLGAPLTALAIAALGIAISAVAGYVSLLYGGYANRNWEKADRIAEKRGWQELLPSDDKAPGYTLVLVARRWARSCRPDELAPVFTAFVVLAAASLAGHLGILFWSVVTLWKG